MINISDLILVYIMYCFLDEECFFFFFVVLYWEGELCNMELDKCDDLRFIFMMNWLMNVVFYVEVVINYI